MTFERLKACKEYFLNNAPDEAILERFGEVIRDHEIEFCLYDEQTDTFSGLVNLLFTKAIAHDFSEGAFGGFSERYCYEDPLLALEELIAWHGRSFNEQRPAGWVACRNVPVSEVKGSFERFHSEGYGRELLPYANGRGISKYSDLIDNRELISRELGYDQNQVKHLSAYLKLIGLVV